MRLIVILVSIVLVSGCATTGQRGALRHNSIPGLKSMEGFLENSGILLLSAGRDEDPCKECNANWAGILPFVSYHIFLIKEGGEPSEIAFIPAERGMFNELGKEHYGFIHFREVLAGNYVMKGALTRGESYGENLLEKLINKDKNPDITFEFEIKPGVINYLGEFITRNGKPITSSIQVNNSKQRDYKYLLKKYPELEAYKVLDVKVKKL